MDSNQKFYRPAVRVLDSKRDSKRILRAFLLAIVITIALFFVLASGKAAGSREPSIYHTHKLSTSSVAVGCDQGTPHTSTLDNLIIVTCK